jgi:hypothetical protein
MNTIQSMHGMFNDWWFKAPKNEIKKDKHSSLFVDPEDHFEKEDDGISLPLEIDPIDFKAGGDFLEEFNSSDDEEGYESGGDDYVIEILQVQQPEENDTLEKMTLCALNLKTQDSFLKCFTNATKIMGLDDLNSASKLFRNGVKYASGWQSIQEGKVQIDQLHPAQLVSSYKDRKKSLNASFTICGLASDSLRLLSTAGSYIAADHPAVDTLAKVVPFISIPTMALKSVCKLSSFESAIRDNPELSSKNIVLIRSSLEVAREFAKIGVVITGTTNPIILTSIAVTGVATGAMGLYLTCREQLAS